MVIADAQGGAQLFLARHASRQFFCTMTDILSNGYLEVLVFNSSAEAEKLARQCKEHWNTEKVAKGKKPIYDFDVVSVATVNDRPSVAVI